MLTNLNRMEGQEDLRIVEHLDMQKLPESVQQMLSLASTPEERDIILMATLAAASACVPNLYFTYGPTGKKYYANLQCFILAEPGGRPEQPVPRDQIGRASCRERV